MPLPRFEKLDGARRAAILDAAIEELAERGFDGASYNRIIARAGISKGAMYYYFSDRDDLFRTALEAALSEWMSFVAVPFEADDAAAFWNACEAMYARSLRFMRADPRSAALCFGLVNAKARHEPHPLLDEVEARMLELTTTLIARGRSLGAVREDIELELLVHSVLGLMDAGDRYLAPRFESLSEADVEPTARLMVGLLRRIGAPEKEST